jgi:hypothetical protein
MYTGGGSVRALFQFPEELFAVQTEMKDSTPTSMTIWSALDGFQIKSEPPSMLAATGAFPIVPSLKTTVFADELEIDTTITMQADLSIFARRLVLPNTSSSSPAFTLNGATQNAAVPPLPPFDPPRAATGQGGQSATLNQAGTEGGPGVPGHPGQDGGQGPAGVSGGLPGGDAAALTIVVGILLVPSGFLIIEARGGSGQAGQDGQAGGNGGDGGSDLWFLPPFAPPGNEIHLSGGRGGRAGQGGRGGNGGQGGAGGRGGSVAVAALTLEPTALIPRVNVQGGVPSRGGAGGRGGETGLEGIDGNTHERRAYVPGGTGGDGGSAGAQGPGGTVLFAPVSVSFNGCNLAAGLVASGGAGGAGGAGVAWEVLPGPKGAEGKSSASAANGVANHKTMDNTDLAAACSPRQLEMMLRKAKLLYLTADPETNPAGYGEARTLLSWLYAVSSPFAGTKVPINFSRSEVTSAVSVFHEVSGLLAQMGLRRDFYGNARSYVPQGSLEFYSSQLSMMLGSSGTFTEIETSYLNYFGALQKRTVTLQDLSGAVVKARSNIQAANSDYQAGLAAAAAIVPILAADDAAVAAQYPVMVTAISGLEEKMAQLAGANCVFQNIVSGLDTLSSMGSEEAGVAGAFGKSVESGVQFNIQNTYGLEKLPTNYFVSRLDMLGTDVETVNDGFEVSGGYITEEDPNAYKLVMTADQFNQTIEPYLGLPTAQIAKDTIDHYVALVKQRNADIVRYNEYVAQAVAAYGRMNGLQAALTEAQTAISNNSDPALPALASFAASTYHDARQQVLHAIYMASRSYMYWSLDTSYSTFSALTGLTDPTGINSASLNELFNGILTQYATALEKFGTAAQTFPAPGTPAVPPGITLTLNKTSCPGLFASLFRLVTWSEPDGQGHLTQNSTYRGLIKLSAALPTTHADENPFAGKANVRLTYARAWVHGAKTTSGILHVLLTRLEDDTIVDPSGRIFEFTRNPIPRAFAYTLSRTLDPSGITQDSRYYDPTGPNTHTTYDYAPPGPFGTWLLEIRPGLNPGLDISGVDTVTLEFGGSFYPFP